MGHDAATGRLGSAISANNTLGHRLGIWVPVIYIAHLISVYVSLFHLKYFLCEVELQIV
jgi:hypothetical protein